MVTHGPFTLGPWHDGPIPDEAFDASEEAAYLVLDAYHGPVVANYDDRGELRARSDSCNHLSALNGSHLVLRNVRGWCRLYTR